MTRTPGDTTAVTDGDGGDEPGQIAFEPADAGEARYVIEGVVGRGGRGVILRARDRRLGRPVAITRRGDRRRRRDRVRAQPGDDPPRPQARQRVRRRVRRDAGDRLGLAQELDDAGVAPAEPDRRIVGTPAYMAPEQARGERADYRSDVFAVGAILWTVLTGRPPRRGAVHEMTEAAAREAPPPAEDVEPAVPRDLAAICRRALAFAPDDRYPSARELAEDLRRFLTGRMVAARSYTRGQRLLRWVARRRAIVAVAAVSAVVLAVVAGTMLARIVDERGRAERERRRAEEQTARLLLDQARSSLDRDPARALASVRRLLASPAADAVALEDVRVIVAEARARGVTRYARDGVAYAGGIRGTADGRFAVARDLDGAVTVWDLADGRVHARVGGAAAGGLGALAVAPDGGALAIADGDAVVVRALDGRELRRVAAAASALGFTPGGELIVARADGNVTLGAAQLILDAPAASVLGLAGGAVAVATAREVVHWNPASGATARAALDAEPILLTAARDGGRIGVMTAKGTSVLAVGPDLRVVERHPCCGMVAFGPGDLSVVASRTGLELRWRTGAIAFPHPQNAWVAFAGSRLIAVDQSNRLFVFDELPPAPTDGWRLPEAVRYVKSIADGRLAYFTIGGEIGVIDGAAGARALSRLPADYHHAGVYLLPLGDRLLFGGTARTADALAAHVRALTSVE